MPVELLVYVPVILFVLFISPRGLFVLQTLFAMVTGRQRPVRYVKNVMSKADSEAMTLMHIREMSEHMSELQQNLQEVSIELENIRYENEALKDHIRDMEKAKHGQGMASSEDTGHDLLNDYEILGLSDNPPPGREKIQAAFRDMAREMHPDRGGNSEDFKNLVAAYERLMREK